MKLTMLIAAAALLTSAVAHSQTPRGDSIPASAGILKELPLAFVENQGQWETPARFVARMGPLVARAEPGALVVQLEERDEEGAGDALVARLVFEGAREGAELVGRGKQPGVRNYHVGDKARWRTGVSAYSRVLYRGLHEGIDLRLREGVGGLEYDLLLAPDADLDRFIVRCEGILGLELEEDGTLVMQTDLGPVRHSVPDTWQVLPSGERHGLSCRFVLLGEKRFGFELDERLAGLPVVIDPGLEWSTYLGGSSDDWLNHGRLDAAGRLVLIGATSSNDFPGMTGGLSGGRDAFATMLDPSQTGANQLIWSTIVGGSSGDKFIHVELDSTGAVIASGSSYSTDLVATANAYDTSPSGMWDAILCALDNSSGTVQYLTFFGGSGTDSGSCIKVQDPRIVTFGGTTFSTNLPTVGAYQTTNGGGLDLYFARLDLNQSGPQALLYSTYLGGANNEGFPEMVSSYSGAMDMDVLPSGEFAVTAMSTSLDYPTSWNAYDSTRGGNQDTVLTIIDPSIAGSGGLSYSTYIGGDANGGGGTALAVGGDGVVTLGGFTYSADFPTTPGAYSESFIGPYGYNDAFLLQLDPALNPPPAQLLYSSFLSGDGYESVMNLTLDPGGDVMAVGFTGYLGLANNSFPVTCGAHDESFGGAQDGFLLYLSPSGNGVSDLLYSTFFGDSDIDDLRSVELMLNGALDAVATGCSLSSNCALVNEFQTYQGGIDGVALRLEINPHTYCAAGANSVGPDGALICGTGSLDLVANNFTVSVAGAPASQFGLFFFGPNPVQVPFGEGFRCVGVAVWRLNPAQPTTTAGTATRPVDFTSSPGNKIAPGTNTHFQFWYRDPAGGVAGFNLSNGLKVYFYP